MEKPTAIKKEYYAHGKLLISGEYAVLDGAKALAIPTRWGQKMTIKNSRGSDLIWESIDKDGNTWFESHISLYDFSAVSTSDETVSKNLQNILKNAVRLDSEFLNKWTGFKVETQLEFDRSWGLGSSSTLYALMAMWVDIHPLELYYKCENGSGYDVAVSYEGSPLTFINDQDEISYTPIDYLPSFADDLYFVHLGVKKDSKTGIKEYLKHAKKRSSFVKKITEITDQFIECKSLEDFGSLMEEHEKTVHEHTGFPIVKELHFSDFTGQIKSLGAWGGDFILVASNEGLEKIRNYFSNKGYSTIIPYKKMML